MVKKSIVKVIEWFIQQQHDKRKSERTIKTYIRVIQDLTMKPMIITLVASIIFIMAFGSLQSSSNIVHRVIQHDSFLGAIEYNEYGTIINKDHQLNIQGIFINLIFLVITSFIGLFKIQIPESFWWPFVRLRKLQENLLPKQFQSRIFVPCT